MRAVASSRGFTLIELLGTIVILAILGSVASSVLLSATDRFLDSATAAQLNTEASIALDRLAREVRRIDRDAGATGIAPDIDAVTANSLQWQGNNSVTLSGTTLELVISGAAAQPLLMNVTSFAIAAYDESDLPVTLPATADACDPVRRIEMSVEVTRHGVTVPLRSRVFLRSTLAGAGS